MKLELGDLSNKNVLVIGDIMLDRYWHGNTARISPEAPVPVVEVIKVEDRLGGAANVAANLASLGAAVTLMGVIGEDDNGTVLKRLLAERNIQHKLVMTQKLPTTTKLRILSQAQQLIRLDVEKTTLPEDSLIELSRIFYDIIDSFDLVVLSDYAKGVLVNPRVYIEKARVLGKKVVLDPKKREFQSYYGASILTPNLREFETVVGPCGGSRDILITKARELLDECALEALVITQGKEGMMVVTQYDSHHIAATSHEVFDVTGAGDTVIASLAVGILANLDIIQAAKLAAIAAGIAVSKVGTATVTRFELEQALQNKEMVPQGIMQEAELIAVLEHCRMRNETIVMVNGCYDIIHPGHIIYLEKAKSFGDRLIVAVNTDESVARRKGPGRPVNNLQSRMEVLAGLKAVDWVVAFDEDQPGRIVTTLKPDVLVKTKEAFNSVEDIPEEEGARAVLEAHGKVVLLDYTTAYSSSKIVAAMNPT